MYNYVVSVSILPLASSHYALHIDAHAHAYRFFITTHLGLVLVINHIVFCDIMKSIYSSVQIRFPTNTNQPTQQRINLLFTSRLKKQEAPHLLEYSNHTLSETSYT